MKNLFKSLFVVFAFLAANVCYSQTSAAKSGSLEEGTLKSQFDFIMRKSTNYQGHKVIKKQSIDKFYGNFNDSLRTAYKDITALNDQVLRQQSNIDSFKVQVTRLESDVAQVSKEKNSFSLFGLLLNKNTYNTLMWGLILALAGALSLFVFRFKRSHALTTKAKSSYNKTKEEFDAFRQKTLEKEQKLMRELQDELNKNTMNMG